MPCSNAMLKFSTKCPVQIGHFLEHLFEQELSYTLGPTVRQESTLTDSRTSRRRGGVLEHALNKHDRNQTRW
jgi:hypothetical protein